jgi:phosphohistidine phosphatase SixA
MLISRRPWIAILAFAAMWMPGSLIVADDHPSPAGPRAVYIIRHAEKPDAPDDPNLAPRGYERADALARVFPQNFCKPDFIWATASSKKSNRPMETVQPLAKTLQMAVLDQYPTADVAKLAHDLLTQPRYSGKSILICWHHGEIPALAKSLGASDAPGEWKPDVFDRVWVLRFVDGHVQFQDLPQKALAGDSQN